MNNILFMKNDLKKIKFSEYQPGTQGLKDLLALTRSPGVQMLPIDVDTVNKRHDNELPQVIATCGEVAVGFAGVTGLHGKRHLEVGSLIVSLEHRGQGVAGELLLLLGGLISEKYPGWVPVAFCNDKSSPIFKKHGYENTDGSSLPCSLFELCDNCPSRPADSDSRKCCDTVYIKNL